MKRTLLAASLALVASGLLFAQEPADLAKSPAVQETQEVENELLEFPVDALTKSMNNSLSKKGLVLGGINNDGSIYMIGSATTARPSNMSGFINSRNVAFNIAEMTAKMNILRLAGEQITSGRGFTLLEDIIDTGFTMKYVKQHLLEQGAAEVRLATLLFKPDALQCDLEPDYVGLTIPSAFIVGHGLDYDEQGRAFRDIYQLVQED